VRAHQAEALAEAFAVVVAITPEVATPCFVEVELGAEVQDAIDSAARLIIGILR
jgi:hypothetical protein